VENIPNSSWTWQFMKCDALLRLINRQRNDTEPLQKLIWYWDISQFINPRSKILTTKAQLSWFTIETYRMNEKLSTNFCISVTAISLYRTRQQCGSKEDWITFNPELNRLYHWEMTCKTHFCSKIWHFYSAVFCSTEHEFLNKDKKISIFILYATEWQKAEAFTE